MGWLTGLFGGKAESNEVDATFESTEYQGFTIQPQPMEEGGQYRVSALISKDDQEHRFIRSDVIPTQDECVSLTLIKAKKLIDEQGESIF